MAALRTEGPPAVLVTGAGGFLGRHVVRRMAAADWRVMGLDLPGTKPEPAAAQWADADLANPAGLEALLQGSGVIAVVHAGGISGPMVHPHQPSCIHDINVGGTVALLEAMRVAGIQRLVFCSSMDVYGSTEPNHPGETAPIAPATVYAASKAAAECLIQGWCAQYGLTAVALRLGWIYGPGRTTQCSITDRLVTLKAGEGRRSPAPAPQPTRETIAPYLYVEDAAEVVAAALAASGPPFAVMDVAGPDAIAPDSVGALVDRVIAGGALNGSGLRDGPPMHALERALGYCPRTTLPQGIQALRAHLDSRDG